MFQWLTVSPMSMALRAVVRPIAFGFVLVSSLLAAGFGVGAADFILFNGRIVTLDKNFSVVEALAIRGNQIEAVGASSNIRQMATPSTRLIDLGGRTVIPGLIDSHIHAIRAGLRFGTEISWIGAHSIKAAMARIAEVAIRTRSSQWLVVAGGWTPQQFKERRRPTRAELEAAAGNHPAYVQLFYGAALLTRRAAKLLDITSDQDVTPKGRIERDAAGMATDWISGNARSITGLYARLPQPTLEQSIDGTRLFFRELNRVGLTGVIDPGGYNLAPRQYEALFGLWRKGGLTVRVAYSICAPKGGDALGKFQTLLEDLLIASLTRGMTCSAMSWSDFLVRPSSTQSIPAMTSSPKSPVTSRNARI
jgi:predicted amidohydrolase YtcJ